MDVLRPIKGRSRSKWDNARARGERAEVKAAPKRARFCQGEIGMRS